MEPWIRRVHRLQMFNAFVSSRTRQNYPSMRRKARPQVKNIFSNDSCWLGKWLASMLATVLQYATVSVLLMLQKSQTKPTVFGWWRCIHPIHWWVDPRISKPSTLRDSRHRNGTYHHYVEAENLLDSGHSVPATPHIQGFQGQRIEGSKNRSIERPKHFLKV